MRSQSYWKAIVAGVAAFIALLPNLAAATPAKDIQVVARLLTFLENGPTGRTVIGIVFDSDKPESVAEKNAIMAALGSGYSAGKVTLVGKPMRADAVGGAKVLFITQGVNFAAVGAEAKANNILTIGSAPICVRSGACVVGVATDPTVQIVVNRRAAVAAGATFKSAFRMMIHEF